MTTLMPLYLETIHFCVLTGCGSDVNICLFDFNDLERQATVGKIKKPGRGELLYCLYNQRGNRKNNLGNGVGFFYNSTYTLYHLKTMDNIS